MSPDLKKAIENYCSKLPYFNVSSQPHDDNRLYTISYYLVKTKELFDEDFFKKELRKNSKASLNILNDAQFEEFVENRINEIQRGSYIIERISNLIF
jgi:spermidine/putrescine-binding protein